MMAASYYSVTLPYRWLKATWVTSFCKVQSEEGDGIATTTTAATTTTSSTTRWVWSTEAIENPGLLLWIRNEYYPQVTGKQYRNALREMCKDQRPGYRESLLSDDLRQLLKERMQKLGKRLWGCQMVLPNGTDNINSTIATAAARIAGVVASAATISAATVETSAATSTAATAAATSTATSSVATAVATSAEVTSPATSPATAEAISAETAVAISGTATARATSATVTNSIPTVSRSASVSHSSAWASAPALQHNSSTNFGLLLAPVRPTQQLQQLPRPTLLLHPPAPPVEPTTSSHVQIQPHSESRTGKRVATERPFNIGQTVVQSIAGDIVFIPDQFQNPNMGDGFGSTGVGGMSDAPLEFVQATTDNGSCFPDLGLDFDIMQSTVQDNLENNQDNAGSKFVQDFEEVTESFNDCGLVSVADFHDLERHFTSCFSDPSVMAFLVVYIDRYQTLKPDPYANQTCIDLIGVDLRKVFYNPNNLSTSKRIHELFQCTPKDKMGKLSEVWMNCFDIYNNPIEVLCDLWLPNIIVNSNECMCVFAPHATVTMLREPGPYPPDT